MKRNFAAPITTLDGVQMIDPDLDASGKPKIEGGKLVGTPVTLGSVCVNALQNPYDDERPAYDEKIKRFKLAMRIHDAKAPIEVDAEEIALLKSLIAKGHSVIATGRAVTLLESDPEQPAEQVA